MITIKFDRGWEYNDHKPLAGQTYDWMNRDGYVDVAWYSEDGTARLHVELPYPDAENTKPTVSVQVDQWGDDGAVTMTKRELRDFAYALLQAADVVDQYKSTIKEN